MVKTADDERVLGCLMRASALQPISDRWRRIRQGVENYLFALLHKYGIIFANHACNFFLFDQDTRGWSIVSDTGATKWTFSFL